MTVVLRSAVNFFLPLLLGFAACSLALAAALALTRLNCLMPMLWLRVCWPAPPATARRGAPFCRATPRIAGKPAEYLYHQHLYHQLVNFRHGRCSYPQVGYLLENLANSYLQEMAVPFAALQVPHPAAPAPPPRRGHRQTCWRTDAP